MTIHQRTFRNLAAAGALILLSAGAFGFLVWKLQDNQKTTLSIKETIDQSIVRAAHNDSLEQTIRTTTSLQDGISAFFLREEQVPELLVMIESIGSASGSKIEIMSVGEMPKIEGVLLPITIKVRVEGSWRAVTHAALLLESLPYASRVTELQFSKTGTGPTSGWNVIATLETPLRTP